MNHSIHYETSNMSFLQVHKQLKELGIKNNTFFLKLLNPKLSKIDPFSDNLSSEDEAAMMIEIIMNPWYFLRECCRMPDMGSIDIGKPFELNLMGLTSIYLSLNNIDSYLIGPRATYKTGSIRALLEWIFVSGQTNTPMYIHDLKPDDSVQNIYFIYQMVKLLPKFLQPKIKSSYGVKRRYTAENIMLRNKFITQSKINIKDPIAVDMYGRSMVYPIQFFNNFEFIKDNSTIYDASIPAFKLAAKKAMYNKNHYFRVFTSTIGQEDTASRYFGEILIRDAVKWEPIYFDMSLSDLNNLIAKQSINGMVYVEYRYDQLGLDDVWFKRQCRDMNYNQKHIERELLLNRNI